MNRKGFVYLFEVVIVSVILIVSIPYIIPPFKGKIDWSESKLTTTGKDMLEVMEGKDYLEDIMEESSSIDAYMKTILEDEENSIGFNIRSEGAYKNKIRVACNCTKSERAQIQSILSPIYFNGRIIEFTVFRMNYDNLADLDIDVLFLNDYNDLAAIRDHYKAEVEQKVRKGMGIIEFTNLGNVIISNTAGIQEEIFGIKSSTQPSGNLTFKNRQNVSKINYKLGEIFYGVDVDVFLGQSRSDELKLWGNNYDMRTMDSDGDGDYEVDISNDTVAGYEYIGLDETDKFSINNYNFSVEKIRRNGTVVLLNVLDEYKFHNFVINDDAYPVNNEEDRIVLESSGSKPGVIVNRTDGGGRTVWVSRGDGDDIRGLVKSSVLWASKRGWWNILKSVTGEKIQIKRVVSQGEEVYEPYVILMELWYLY